MRLRPRQVSCLRHRITWALVSGSEVASTSARSSVRARVRARVKAKAMARVGAAKVVL
jgi:hypothetical protein